MPDILPANSVGALGYAAAALLLTTLAILLLTTWRGRLQGGLLLAAVVANALWAVVLAAQAQWQSLPVELVWAAEAARMLAWLLFLMRMLQLLQTSDKEQLRALRWSIVFASLLLMLPFEGMLLAVLPGYGGAIGNVRLIGLVILMVAGLFLVEQIYRNTPWQHRWGSSFYALGSGRCSPTISIFLPMPCCSVESTAACYSPAALSMRSLSRSLPFRWRGIRNGRSIYRCRAPSLCIRRHW